MQIGGVHHANFEVNAYEMVKIGIPRASAYLGDRTEIIKKKGIQIRVDDGQANIVVYAHI